MEIVKYKYTSAAQLRKSDQNISSCEMPDRELETLRMIYLLRTYRLAELRFDCGIYIHHWFRK